MDFRNSTDLDGARLERLFVRHSRPYRHDKLTVRVRYSRGADFSGTCYYTEGRIFVNLGRHNRYPYTMGTHIARSRSNRTHWWRETYRMVLADAYQLTLFVYLHELYHYLVLVAGRNPRRKEAMCDRFATRALVDHFGCRVTDSRGRGVARETWDFQDVRAFVATAPQEPPRRAARTPLEVPRIVRPARPEGPEIVPPERSIVCPEPEPEGKTRPGPHPEPRSIPVTILGVRTGTRRPG